MQPAYFKNPGLARVVWALGLAVVLGLTVGWNVWLGRYIGALRARDPGFHWAAADSLVRQNDFVGAFAELEEAFRLAPDRYEPYQIAGNLHYELRHWREAFKAYQDAIARGCPDVNVRVRSVLALMRQDRFENAAALGKQYISEGQTYPGFPRYVGEAYRRLHQDAEAIPFLEMALRGYPNDVLLMEGLMEAYVAVGESEKAGLLHTRIGETRAILDGLTEAEQ